MDGYDEWRYFKEETMFADTPERQKDRRLKELKKAKEQVKRICELTEEAAGRIDFACDAETHRLAFEAFSIARVVYKWLEKEERNCKRRKP